MCFKRKQAAGLLMATAMLLGLTGCNILDRLAMPSPSSMETTSQTKKLMMEPEETGFDALPLYTSLPAEVPLAAASSPSQASPVYSLHLAVSSNSRYDVDENGSLLVDIPGVDCIVHEDPFTGQALYYSAINYVEETAGYMYSDMRTSLHAMDGTELIPALNGYFQPAAGNWVRVQMYDSETSNYLYNIATGETAFEGLDRMTHDETNQMALVYEHGVTEPNTGLMGVVHANDSVVAAPEDSELLGHFSAKDGYLLRSYNQQYTLIGKNLLPVIEGTYVWIESVGNSQFCLWDGQIGQVVQMPGGQEVFSVPGLVYWYNETHAIVKKTAGVMDAYYLYSEAQGYSQGYYSIKPIDLAGETGFMASGEAGTVILNAKYEVLASNTALEKLLAASTIEILPGLYSVYAYELGGYLVVNKNLEILGMDSYDTLSYLGANPQNGKILWRAALHGAEDEYTLEDVVHSDGTKVLQDLLAVEMQGNRLIVSTTTSIGLADLEGNWLCSFDSKPYVSEFG